MLGQMMRRPLTISSQIQHAEAYHADTTITSVETNGGKVVRTWGQTARQSRKLASALTKLGLKPGDRCATIAWNNYRHLEVYFGVSGGGFVCHTINPRLFKEQLIYVINHAEDQVLFFDETFLETVGEIASELRTVKKFVMMASRDRSTSTSLVELEFYDELIETGTSEFEWPELEEDSASSLCYTSGTTGNPKGVLYSHRSTVLHSLAAALPDSFGLSATDAILPVVPMFHVNAWGVPYAAAMVGARLVMPGPALDGESLVKLIDQEGVTIALGVPTIWQGLLSTADATGSKMPSLNRTVIGGSACPPWMISKFRDDYDVETIHAWGMTELSPVGTVNKLLAKHQELEIEEQARLRESQGRPPFGIELKIVGDDNSPLKLDGEEQGDLLVRGHWVVDSYFGNETGSAITEGWFDTGDVATIDPNGFMTIKDRSKDIIKSGGEWISSVELENIASAHPGISDVAAIGAKHPKWDERPVLIAVRAKDGTVNEQELIAYFEDKVAKWQIPDAVAFVDAIPRNATGKILKKVLRKEFSNMLIGGA